jgi:hypothetical protein
MDHDAQVAIKDLRRSFSILKEEIAQLEQDREAAIVQEQTLRSRADELRDLLRFLDADSPQRADTQAQLEASMATGEREQFRAALLHERILVSRQHLSRLNEMMADIRPDTLAECMFRAFQEHERLVQKLKSQQLRRKSQMANMMRRFISPPPQKKGKEKKKDETGKERWQRKGWLFVMLTGGFLFFRFQVSADVARCCSVAAAQHRGSQGAWHFWPHHCGWCGSRCRADNFRRVGSPAVGQHARLGRNLTPLPPSLFPLSPLYFFSPPLSLPPPPFFIFLSQ